MSKNNLGYNKENRSKSPGLPPSSSDSSSNDTEYNSIPSDRFYTEKEEITLRFYQTPKALFKNPKYRRLSLDPKLMYSILRDRLDMSIKNNWKDEKGYIFNFQCRRAFNTFRNKQGNRYYIQKKAYQI